LPDTADTLGNVQRLDLVGVRVELPANTPVVLLREATGRRRLLPILIGSPEAQAIHSALEGQRPPRPFTHDLFGNTLTELGITLQRIVITEIREHTYYATLYLASAGGEHAVSARPSDAIALAVRMGSEIFAEDALLDEVGQEEPALDEDEHIEEEILDEFHDFIESVKPEDFES
jgi:hypothetical protein